MRSCKVFKLSANNLSGRAAAAKSPPCSPLNQYNALQTFSFAGLAQDKTDCKPRMRGMLASNILSTGPWLDALKLAASGTSSAWPWRAFDNKSSGMPASSGVPEICNIRGATGTAIALDASNAGCDRARKTPWLGFPALASNFPQSWLNLRIRSPC